MIFAQFQTDQQKDFSEMATLTINIKLENFTIDDVQEGSHIITALGHTTEKEVSCRVCGNVTDHFHGYDVPRKVRHPDLARKPFYILYCPRRYMCFDCDLLEPTTTATPSFHYVKSQFTYEFELYIILDLVNSTVTDVAKKNNVTEKEVQGIVDRHLAGKVDWSQFKTLGIIGIDEIAIKKGRSDYITVITALIEGKTQILGVILGRKKADIKRFLKSIPVKLKKTIVAVCIDMYIGYVNAAKEVFKKGVAIVVDRYDVAKLYRKSLDKFRQEIIGELKQHLSAEEYEKIKHVTTILRGNKEFFTKEEKGKLNAIFSQSFELSEAYRLVRALTHIFNSNLTVKEGLSKFAEWILDVRKTKLTFLNTFIKTLTKFKQEIANYFIDRQTSGFGEGFNNKIKVMKRRCYGITNLKHLFQRLFLDTSGYDLYAVNIGVS
jgi:transposase